MKPNAYMLAKRATGGEGVGSSIFIFGASWSTTCRHVPFHTSWSVAVEPKESLKDETDLQHIEIAHDPVAQLDRAPAF